MSAVHGTNLSLDGLVVLLDPSSGGSNTNDGFLRDMSGNGNDAELIGGVINNTGFTTSTSTDGAVFDLDGPNIWTISMLLRRTGSVNGAVGRIAGTNGVIDRGEIAIGDTAWAGVADRIYLNGPKGSWIQTTATLQQNEDAYLCFIFDRTQQTSPNTFVYKNGVLQFSTIEIGSDEGPITGYTLGSRSDFNGEYVPHTFYHVSVHNKKLSDNEIKYNFEALRRRINL